MPDKAVVGVSRETPNPEPLKPPAENYLQLAEDAQVNEPEQFTRYTEAFKKRLFLAFRVLPGIRVIQCLCCNDTYGVPPAPMDAYLAAMGAFIMAHRHDETVPAADTGPKPIKPPRYNYITVAETAKKTDPDQFAHYREVYEVFPDWFGQFVGSNVLVCGKCGEDWNFSEPADPDVLEAAQGAFMLAHWHEELIPPVPCNRAYGETVAKATPYKFWGLVELGRGSSLGCVISVPADKFICTACNEEHRPAPFPGSENWPVPYTGSDRWYAEAGAFIKAHAHPEKFGL